ncbi:hypothetical protein [Streptomyces sp. 2231.1]|uniref:hypothetical protein n=1 Tax=Streptomyces sp. 2231.1 TaxID=1855347 RepID=UPI00115FF596|nr:hypothetical protein [Streptomyces sp. 2231.1]
MRAGMSFLSAAVLAAASVGVATGTAQAAAPLRPANLDACQGSINLTNVQVENLCAVVTDAATGQPLAGKQIDFYTGGGQFLGTSYTNQAGMAHADGPVNLPVGAAQLILTGYTATMAGDGIYTPVSDHAPVTVGTDGSFDMK